jgi:polar amino acid transport system substrate-binding protein
MKFFSGSIISGILFFLIVSSAHGGKTLELTVEDSAGPWSQKNGEGYANDVVKAAYKAVGITVKLHVTPYSRCKRLAIEGKTPACFSVSPEPGLEQFLVLSDSPIFKLTVDFYHHKKKPFTVAGVSELPSGIVVGIVLGYEYPAPVTKLKERGIVLETAKDETSNLKKLSHGRIDLAIINNNEIKLRKSLLDSSGTADKVEFSFRGGELFSYIAFSKKNPLGEFARKKFNQGFKKIKANRTLISINTKWIRRMEYPAETE